MKKSKLQRKFVNQMRSMGDIPWPARRFKYPTTSAEAVSRVVHVGQCSRKVGETKTKRRRLSRARTVDVACGGRLIAKLGRNRRRVYCEDCRERKAQRKQALRLEQKINRLSPREAVAQERRTVSALKRFRRKVS